MGNPTHRRIIDCDLHQTYVSQEELYPFLPETHLARLKEKGFGYVNEPFVTSWHNKRLDAKPATGPIGSSYELVREQWLDKFNISYAVLTGEGMSGVSYMTDRAYPTALAAAYNDWLVNTWLNYDQRFLGALNVALQDPEAAAAEIYRSGGHPRVVQVVIPAATPMPISHPFYRPVLRAAADMNLVLGFHFRQPSIAAPYITPIGVPPTYLDYHVLISLPYMSQVAMLISSGVLEELPNLKFVLIEGGFLWAIHLMWRFDKEYKTLRREAPMLKKMPSEYLKQHFKFGIQPIYEPPETRMLHEAIEAGGLQKNLVFAGDYPHWDADEPDFAMRFLKPEWQDDILYNNLAPWYKHLQTAVL